LAFLREDINRTGGLLAVGGGGAPLSAEIWFPDETLATDPPCQLPSPPRQLRYHSLDFSPSGAAIACALDSCSILDDVGWHQGPTTTYTRLEHTSVVTGRGLFLMGGAFSPNTTEMIDPDSEEDFVESFPLLPGRISHCAIQVSLSSVILTGGYTTPSLVTEYSGLDKESIGVVQRELPPLTSGRWHHACGSYFAQDSQVLIVVGGVDAEQALAGSELLDLSTAGSTWSPSTPLPAPMWGARGVLLGGRFLLVGGFAGSYQHSLLAWDSVSQVWEVAGNLLDGRYYHAVANIPTNCHIDKLCQF